METKEEEKRNEQTQVTTRDPDEEMVQAAFQRLLDTYLSSPHRKKTEIITKAFNFAKQAHKGVRRLSGEPYIMHPIAVAQIACGEIGLGSTSVCAALLHDVVEDTDYTVDDITNLFGPKIAQIVDGLTKISGGIFGDKASAQAESFKKLLLTMSDDIRVILIKISDRLHNMRTLGSQLPGKQYKIAGETLYIYAPLAHRLGLNLIKEELEDLSFRYEHPEAHAQLCQQLAEIEPQLQEAFQDFIKPIRERLDRMGYKYTVRARIKRPYSCWMKMQNKHVAFEEIYDLLAARIVFTPKDEDNEEGECFQIYNACTRIYRPHPERFRDWLSQPKANGYRALHTTLMSHKGRWVEVQIRSQRMDDMAECGFAAHWKYKEGEKGASASETELEKWLSTIKELLDDPQPSAMDFLDTIKLNLYASEIFVVTPKGEFKTMPAGATVLDFAFSIHSVVGTHCIGAKVNHQLLPMSHVLKSGDQVEVLTSNTAKVDASWLQHCTTAKAKNKIESILRRQRRDQQKQGEDLLAEWFAAHELEPTSLLIERLCIIHECEDRESLAVALAAGIVTLSDDDSDTIQKPRNPDAPRRWRRFVPFLRRSRKADAEATAPSASPDESSPAAAVPSAFPDGRPSAATSGTPLKIDRKKPIILDEQTIPLYTFCPDCRPIPGDDVLAYHDAAKNRVIIHKRQCPIATRLKTADGNHILAATWDTNKLLNFRATIHIEGIDRVGILRALTDVLTEQFAINVHRLAIDTNDGIFHGDIELSVHDAEDLSVIIKNLKRINGLEEVTRIS